MLENAHFDGATPVLLLPEPSGQRVGSRLSN
jgi:hypothetical protein